VRCVIITEKCAGDGAKLAKAVFQGFGEVNKMWE